MNEAIRVHGSKVSYFTGKLEGYLRYKGIPYTLTSLSPLGFRRIRRRTGAAQVPAVELADGRWLTDTTPIIAWFEQQQPEPEVIPADPLQAFVSRLLEDYADEWLWRPAMHYRWYYAQDAHFMSRRLTDEIFAGLPFPPGPIPRALFRRRQRRGFTRGDGVSEHNRAHVEGIYLHALDYLEAIFAERPFLLGERPTLADFGFFASMFRHFGIDPTPAAIMRERAPGVYAWLARVWDARGDRLGKAPLVKGTDGIPDDWAPILRDIGEAYLPYLCANVEAWRSGAKRFDCDVQGVRYRGCRTSRYRVWCLEQLRAHLEALPEPARTAARDCLETHGAWEPLWRSSELGSGLDPEGRAPFARGAPMLGS